MVYREFLLERIKLGGEKRRKARGFLVYKVKKLNSAVPTANLDRTVLTYQLRLLRALPVQLDPQGFDRILLLFRRLNDELKVFELRLMRCENEL